MDKMLAEYFRQNVQDILEKRGWSRTDLANNMDTSIQYISQYLNGHREPGLTVIEKFADGLKVKAQNLLRPPRAPA